MENLATESFSYSWLTEKPPPPPPPSDNIKRIEHEDDFHFDVVAPPTSHLVNADEIFSEGQIMAVYGDRARTEAKKTSTSFPASPLSVPFLAGDDDRNYPYYILGKWRRYSKKILLKCLGLIVSRRRRRRKSSSRVDDLERKVLEVRSFGNSVEASPTHNSLSSSALDNLRYGFEFGDEFCLRIDQNWRSITTSPSTSSYVCCDADENSIREAILYCKRSILEK